jgi:hypothetical protein
VTYVVEAETPGPIDTLWRWSGTSNVDAGGSCRATVSIGDVTRSMTATTHDQPVLEIPVTVRHGDVLQAKLDAICSSPELRRAARDSRQRQHRDGAGLSDLGSSLPACLTAMSRSLS